MSNIADLMKIFSESSAYDYGKFPKMSERKRQFKETEEGIKEMSEGIQKLIAEEARREAEEAKKKRFCLGTGLFRKKYAKPNKNFKKYSQFLWKSAILKSI